MLPIYLDIDTSVNSWQLRAEIHPAFTPKYLILGNLALDLPPDGEYVDNPLSSLRGSERYSLENGVVKLWHHGASSDPVRTGYIELR